MLCLALTGCSSYHADIMQEFNHKFQVCKTKAAIYHKSVTDIVTDNECFESVKSDIYGYYNLYDIEKEEEMYKIISKINYILSVNKRESEMIRAGQLKN